MNLIRKKRSNDMMTQCQFEINNRNLYDTAITNHWLREQGFDEYTLLNIHINLLVAHQQAQTLLNVHQTLLSIDQVMTLKNFLRLMKNKRSLHKLKPQAAFPVLNISSKINREIFKKHRQLFTKA